MNQQQRRPALTFSGEELFTLECQGSMERARARQLVPEPLVLELVDGRAVIELMYFQMHRLSAFGLGWPSFSYHELLWRVGIVIDGAPAWFGLGCSLDRALVQRSAELLFRYNTERASFLRDESHVFVRGREETVLSFTAKGEAPIRRPRRMLVERRGALYEVFWDERPAVESRRASVAVEGGLSGVRWESEGFLLRGRTHICGVARRSVIPAGDAGGEAEAEEEVSGGGE